MDDLFDQVKAAPPPTKVRQTPPLRLSFFESSLPSPISMLDSTDSIANIAEIISKEQHEEMAHNFLNTVNKVNTMYPNASINTDHGQCFLKKCLKVVIKRDKKIDSMLKYVFIENKTRKNISSTICASIVNSRILKAGTIKQPIIKVNKKNFNTTFENKKIDIECPKTKPCLVHIKKNKRLGQIHSSQDIKEFRKLSKHNSSIANKHKYEVNKLTFSNKKEKYANLSNSGNNFNKSGYKDIKSKNSFFIKLSPTQKSCVKLGQKLKERKKNISDTIIGLKEKINKKSTKFLKNPNFFIQTTKLKRSELIKQYGYRFFCSVVKIEHCNHPQMLTFKSKVRARKLLAKQNKTKNLTVSFSKQVEIFGDTESDADSVSDICPNQINTVTTTLMPARLKKIENGRVIDNIKLNPLLFLDPNNSSVNASITGRTKTLQKNFTTLKCENDMTPNLRREQLKLANERLPSYGLKCFHLDDIDDEDEECEYIVPNEIPKKYSSYINSISQNSSTRKESKIRVEQPLEMIIDSVLLTDNKRYQNKEGEGNESSKKINLTNLTSTLGKLQDEVMENKSKKTNSSFANESKSNDYYENNKVIPINNVEEIIDEVIVESEEIFMTHKDEEGEILSSADIKSKKIKQTENRNNLISEIRSSNTYPFFFGIYDNDVIDVHINTDSSEIGQIGQKHLKIATVTGTDKTEQISKEQSYKQDNIQVKIPFSKSITPPKNGSGELPGVPYVTNQSNQCALQKSLPMPSLLSLEENKTINLLPAITSPHSSLLGLSVKSSHKNVRKRNDNEASDHFMDNFAAYNRKDVEKLTPQLEVKETTEVTDGVKQ